MKEYKRFFILSFMAALSFSACESNSQTVVYTGVDIGEQFWSPDNLDVAAFRNGDLIGEAKTYDEWKAAGAKGKPAWCFYENDIGNGQSYGRLYNWYAVNDVRGLCPTGWHVPSNTEWTELTDYLGGEDTSGAGMKSTSGWTDDWGQNGNGNNSSGFAGLPGGRRDSDGAFFGVGGEGNWWSSTESSEFSAKYQYLSIENGNAYWNFNPKSNGASVRCLMD